MCQTHGSSPMPLTNQRDTENAPRGTPLSGPSPSTCKNPRTMGSCTSSPRVHRLRPLSAPVLTGRIHQDQRANNLGVQRCFSTLDLKLPAFFVIWKGKCVYAQIHLGTTPNHLLGITQPSPNSPRLLGPLPLLNRSGKVHSTARVGRNAGNNIITI